MNGSGVRISHVTRIDGDIFTVIRDGGVRKNLVFRQGLIDDLVQVFIARKFSAMGRAAAIRAKCSKSRRLTVAGFPGEYCELAIALAGIRVYRSIVRLIPGRLIVIVRLRQCGRVLARQGGTLIDAVIVQAGVLGAQRAGHVVGRAGIVFRVEGPFCTRWRRFAPAG